MDGTGAGEPLTLLGLVEPARWQRLQDHFSSLLGIPLRTVGASRALVVNPSWPPGMDAEQTIRLLHMGEELEALISLTEPSRQTSSLTTDLGVTYAAVPIRATSEQIVAYFVVGPVAVGPRDEEAFRRRLGAAEPEAREFWSCVLSLKLYTFAGIRSALGLLEEVGTSIAQLAHQARQLGAVVPATDKIDHAVVVFHTDRILRSLLEAAILATKADGGSVMAYDAKREALEIRVAEGLRDDVVAKTRLPRGEGIAGLAALGRDILVVDDRTTDPTVRNRMRRPEIASSLLAPLSVDADQEPIGILNLRTAAPGWRFTSEHIELLRRLLDLAGAALGSLRLVFDHARRESS